MCHIVIKKVLGGLKRRKMSPGATAQYVGGQNCHKPHEAVILTKKIITNFDDNTGLTNMSGREFETPASENI